jgi:hypothetical protein
MVGKARRKSMSKFGINCGIWLLRWKKAKGVDVVTGFVVKAYSEDTARKLASEKAGDEGTKTWLDSKKSSCDRIGITLAAEDTEEVVLLDSCFV